MNQAEIERWKRELLAPVLRGEQVDATQAAAAGGLALLSADTDRTQAFVFQSPRLVEIRGASMRLDELNLKELPRLFNEYGLNAAIPDGGLIYVGGGSLLAFVPEALADRLVAAIERLYPQRTDVATITAVAQRLDPSALAGTALQLGDGSRRQFTNAEWQRLQQSYAGGHSAPARLMQRQALLLQQRKAAKATVPLVEALPYARRCRSCGVRPVEDFLPGIGGEAARPLCRVCAINGREGRDARSSWTDQFARSRNLAIPPVPDLNAIGEQSKGRKGYIGYIYADGDSIGRLLQSVQDFRSYADISNTLTVAMREALFDALEQELAEADGRTRPFEIITIGGDDALLIVPADVALPVALALCRNFSDRLQQYSATPTMSAGVVIAKSDNPVYFLNGLAKKLLVSAKRAGRERGEPCIDYLVLTSQSTIATTVADIRSSPNMQIIDESQKEQLRLSGRPYTLNQVETMLTSARRVRRANLAPGQLHQLRDNLRRGRLAGMIYYLYQRDRPEMGADVLPEIEALWQMDIEHSPPPWRSQGNDGRYDVFDTPFVDILELRNFVEGG